MAKAYKDRLSRSTVNYQLQAAALTEALRLEAFECFAKLEPVAASLRAAVDHYVAYLAQAVFAASFSASAAARTGMAVWRLSSSGSVLARSGAR